MHACPCRPPQFNYEDDAVVPALLDGPVAAAVHALRMQAALRLLETCIERCGACCPCMHACMLGCTALSYIMHAGRGAAAAAAAGMLGCTVYCSALWAVLCCTVRCGGQGSQRSRCQGISWIGHSIWRIRTDTHKPMLWLRAMAG